MSDTDNAVLIRFQTGHKQSLLAANPSISGQRSLDSYACAAAVGVDTGALLRAVLLLGVDVEFPVITGEVAPAGMQWGDVRGNTGAVTLQDFEKHRLTLLILSPSMRRGAGHKTYPSVCCLIVRD